jgi:hypothetical protein
MTLFSVRRSVCFIAVALATLGSASAQSGSGFPMVGIASGQSAHVNALNAARQDPSNPTSCSLTLQFLDSNGNLLKQSKVNLLPGKAAALDLSWDELPRGDLRTSVRAVLLFGYSGGANPPAKIVQQSACGNLVPSLEVYANDSGRTSFVLTTVNTLPSPATPAQ